MDLCASVLTRLIWTRAINDTAYTYFKPLSDAVWTRTPKSEQEIFDLVRPRITRGWFAAFEIR